MRPMKETAIVYTPQPAGVDAHGNQIKTWGNGTQIHILGLAPGTNTEPAGAGHERLIDALTLYLPATVVLPANARVKIRGTLYEVDGETKIWQHPNGHRPGNTARLKQIRG